MNTHLKAPNQRHNEFKEKLAKLLAEIKTAAEGQFNYNEEVNLKRGIVLPEDSVEHAIKHGVASAWNTTHKWDCQSAIDLAHLVLEDANCHTEAAALLESVMEVESIPHPSPEFCESRSAISGDNF